MKRLCMAAVLALLLTGCASRFTALTVFHEADYQWHKHTLWIKVHWNYVRTGNDTITAEGFVEPFNPKNGVHTVRLELVGMDEEGSVVSSAEGMPADNYIASPFSTSPFRITMKLNGEETDFTIRGSYYFYIVGARPSLDSRSLDYIPLKADEPL